MALVWESLTPTVRSSEAMFSPQRMADGLVMRTVDPLNLPADTGLQTFIDSPVMERGLRTVMDGPVMERGLRTVMDGPVMERGLTVIDGQSWLSQGYGQPAQCWTPVPMSPVLYSSDALTRETRQLQLDLQLTRNVCQEHLRAAREEAKDDVRRCAKEALERTLAQADFQEKECLWEENSRLRGIATQLEGLQRTQVWQLEQDMIRLKGENTYLGDSNVELAQSIIKLEKKCSEHELRLEQQTAARLTEAQKQAGLEVKEVREQLNRLLSSQELLLANNVSLKESSSLREEAIQSLQRQLAEERERVRILQRDFESLKLETSTDAMKMDDLQRKLATVVTERDRMTAEHKLEISDLARLKSCEEESASVRRLQTELDAVRTADRHDVVEALQIAEQAEENLAALKVELSEVREKAISSARREEQAQEKLAALNAELSEVREKARSSTKDEAQAEENLAALKLELSEMRAKALSDLQHLKDAEMERLQSEFRSRKSLENERDSNKLLQFQVESAERARQEAESKASEAERRADEEAQKAPANGMDKRRTGYLPNGEMVVECTIKALRVADFVRVMQPFDVTCSDGQTFLREGLIGKVEHRAFGENGITHIKFEDVSEPAAVLCKDFPKLAIVLRKPEPGATQEEDQYIGVHILPSGEKVAECLPKSLEVGHSVRIMQAFSVRSGDGQAFLREGLVGKVAHRASGERGITRFKFEDIYEQVVVLCKDFRKLAILLNLPETAGLQAMEPHFDVDLLGDEDECQIIETKIQV